MPTFAHLHVHTQFSLLDGAADIKKLMKKAKEDEMKAIAITDHGNMFGAFRFVAEAFGMELKNVVKFFTISYRFNRKANETEPRKKVIRKSSSST